MISIIVPCYNEEETVEVFYAELSKIMNMINTHDFEVYFINDGSKDNTLSILKTIGKQDLRIKYISFSRNFGKETAMYEGFCNVSGDYVAVMDSDMQDPPSLLPQMVKILETEDFDSVATRRETRNGEPLIVLFVLECFTKLLIRYQMQILKMVRVIRSNWIVRNSTYIYYSKKVTIWRSSARLGFFSLLNYIFRRCSVVLYGNYWTIFI